MPSRNTNIILAIVIVSMACYLKADRIRHAGPIAEAIFMIDQFYVEPVDSQKLIEGAMEGVVGQLDPYSQYIDQSSFGHFQDSLQQRFAGIGIIVEKPEGLDYVRVITPLLDTPAIEAGILPGDLIQKVDDVDVKGLDISAVSEKLRGPEGTSVEIQLQRGEAELLTVSVVRASIALESVMGDHRDEDNRWSFWLRNYPRIAYIRLSTFGEKTVGELTAVLSDVPSDCKGLIIDLRQNQGGLLNSAVDISDMFIDEGMIVSTRGRDGSNKEEFRASSGVLLDSGVPMVVLVDGDSASASEILAACLKDHQRAVIVGERSFGKGTVQNVLPLELGRSALKLTTARYYRPNGKNIHRTEGASEEDEWGVRPTEGMLVPMTDEQKLAAFKRLQRAAYPVLNGKFGNTTGDTSASPEAEENVEATETQTTEAAKTDADSIDTDPQLKRAVEVLLGEKMGEKQAAA